MSLPTDRTEPKQTQTRGAFRLAIELWSEALGQSYVIDVRERIHQSEQATFPTSRRIPAILRPSSVSEVQQCLQIANKCRTQIYPSSRGYNWGLGSRVPVETGCVVLDLGRMDQIVEFNDDLSYLVLQPGVTFAQATDYLRQQNSRHFLSVIGGPPDASVLGNLVDRGDGLGPRGDRAEHACGLEVVLGTGEIVRTGFSGLPSSTVAHLHRLGIGPSLDGLFTQSSLGVVTQATVWLNPIPKHFQAFFFGIENVDKLGNAATRLRELQQQRTIEPSSSFLWNAVKAVAALGQHPSPDTGQLDVDEMLRRVSPRFAGAAWLGGGALYAASGKIAAEQRRLVRRGLDGACSRLTFIDQRRYRLAATANRFASAMGFKPPIDPAVLEGLFAKSTHLGYPTRRSIQSLYWRKQMPVPKHIDPHRDRCGLLWACHVVPFTGSAIRQAAEAATATIEEHGFEPNLSFTLKSAQATHMAAQIIWDREHEGDDERAQACHRELEDRLNTLGYTNYRVTIDSMARLPKAEPATQDLQRALKSVCDPNGVLAPGRYESVAD